MSARPAGAGPRIPRGRGGSRRGAIAPAAALLAASTWLAAAASAQDFAAVRIAAGGPFDSIPAAASDLLERGLPAAPPGAALELSVVRWHGLPDLTTRAVAGALGWRAARLGAGLSQTGDPDVGWTALGAALGIADSSGGAALRAVARRDRTSSFGFDARGAAVGVEAGAGAWVAVTPTFTLWASAPQIWTRGEAPPLARALEIGGTARVGGLGVWLAHVTVPGAPRGARGEHAAGVATAIGPVEVALAVRDQPLRGGLALAAGGRPVGVAAAVESHPVLRETVRLAVRVERAP